MSSRNSELAIVIPTYNEADNIELLVKRILAIKDNVELIIVDDNSPDGTGAIIDRLSEIYLQIHVIHRNGSRGRGLAGIEGFKYALSLDVPYIMEMDADFSHNPKYIPDFLCAIKDCDVAIGSRYIKAGNDKRGFMRKLISKLAGIYIRKALKTKVSDPTSGYRCFKRNVLERINLESLISEGPSIVEEILSHCIKNKFKIVETPINFEDRRHGKSNLSLLVLIRTLKSVCKFKGK